MAASSMLTVMLSPILSFEGRHRREVSKKSMMQGRVLATGALRDTNKINLRAAPIAMDDGGTYPQYFLNTGLRPSPVSLFCSISLSIFLLSKFVRTQNKRLSCAFSQSSSAACPAVFRHRCSQFS